MRTMFVKLFFWFWLAMTLSGVVFFLLAFNLRLGPLHGERLERFEAQRRLVARQSLRLFGQTAAASWEEEHSLPAPAADEPGGEIPYLFAADGSPISAAVPPPLKESVANRLLHPSGREERGLVTVQVRGPSGATYLAAMQEKPQPHPVPHDGHFPFPPDFWIRFSITFVVGALVCYGLAWHLTRPIRKLRAATQSLAKGDLGTRVETQGKSGDELHDLGLDFNKMAERIEKLVESHRQLVRDVSHELRSPLTRLTVALELCRKAAPPSAADALDRIELEGERLNQLIGELLTLSRLDGGGSDFPVKELDLAPLLEEVVRDAAYEAHGSGRSVDYGGSLPVVLKGDRELLRRAFENVIRNAIRYTQEGSEVEVSLRKGGGEATVRVLDKGPGVPETALSDIFKPFYRVAESRDRRSGGTGIGLAITERTVTLHGGKVSARNVAGVGLEVEIVLPLEGRDGVPPP